MILQKVCNILSDNAVQLQATGLLPFNVSSYFLVRQDCLNGIGFLPTATKYKLFPDSLSLNITNVVVKAVEGVDYVKAIQEVDLR